MRINVTKQDIDKVTPYEASEKACPIVNAVRRAFAKRKCKVRVFGTGWIVIGRKGFQAPEAACEFIRNFDHGRTVKPFSFELK